MPFLPSQAFAVLHERAARAEALADAASERAMQADARFDRLFAEYTALRQKGADPTPDALQRPSEVPSLPDVVEAELAEFATDAELYAHNLIYAQAELRRGTAPDVVATAIRFGRDAEARDHGEGAE